MDRQMSLNALEITLERLEDLESFTRDSLEGCLRPLAEELELKAGQLFGIIRVAVTGQTVAPPLFETMVVLGKTKCLKRIRQAAARLSGYTC